MGPRRAKGIVQAATVDVAGKALFEQHGIEWIPLQDRRGTPRDLGAMWAGATINVFPVIFGAILISLGLNWIQAVVVIVLGDLGYVSLGLASLAGPLAGTTPAMAFSVVVLPAPLEPKSATMLPCGTSSDTSATPIRSP